MTSSATGRTTGITLIVGSSLFYASYGIWSKLLGDDFGGYTASAIRSALVLMLLVPIAIRFRKLEPIDWQRNGRLLLAMLFATCFVWGPLYFAIQEAGVGLSLATNYGSFILGMFLFGWLLSGEQLTRQKVISGVLGIAGMCLIFLPNESRLIISALAAAALSGFGIAAVSVIAKKLSYGSTQATVALWTTSVLANLALAPIFDSVAPNLGEITNWIYLSLFAVTSVASSWMFVRGLKLIDSGTAAIVGLLEIVFGVLFGVLFFSERPHLLALVGISLIVAAAALPYRRSKSAETLSTL